jgi:16S rRNA (guanine(1405)-N(7))-methyltransferase
VTGADVDKDELNRLIAEIRDGRKYHALNLPESTLRDLILQELPRYKTKTLALQAVRKKLHNLVAQYLGDPDYDEVSKNLERAFAQGDHDKVKVICNELLQAHASTLERIPILTEFYFRLFSITGKPKVILDLACGLNPFAIPWMGLEETIQYHAYDIHLPRVRLINQFMQGWGMTPLAEQRDILVEPPEIEADVAFFFKEAHRFEQRQHGCNRSFWQRLHVKWLLVSLPSENLTGQHSLVDRQRRLVSSTLQGLEWKVEEVTFPTEIVFFIQPKTKGGHCG